MATFEKRGDTWRVRIRRVGFDTITGSFDTRASAEAWARQKESDMDRGTTDVAANEASRTTVAELIERYLSEITVTHKGAESETYRLKAIAASWIGQRKVATVRSTDIVEVRKKRLKSVGPSSVTREMNLLHRVFELARLEWEIGTTNPVAKVSRPPAPPGRDRRLASDEETRLLAACAQSDNSWLRPAVILAIETAMRRGEILRLRWNDINLLAGTATLRDTKNGETRVVPLSARALDTLRALPRDIHGRVFPLTGNALKLAWKRATKRANINKLRFHDLRHEAVSRLVETGKLGSLEVAAITGHKDLKSLKRYFHPRAEELRKKLGW